MVHGTIWLAPDAPTANFASPLSTQTVGHMFDEFILFPPDIDVGYPGLGSKYDTELFINTPVLGRTTFEPKRLSNVYVNETILPSESTALMWEVQP